jgi:hypothetical protein
MIPQWESSLTYIRLVQSTKASIGSTGPTSLSHYIIIIIILLLIININININYLLHLLLNILRWGRPVPFT